MGKRGVLKAHWPLGRVREGNFQFKFSAIYYLKFQEA